MTHAAQPRIGLHKRRLKPARADKVSNDFGSHAGAVPCTLSTRPNHGAHPEKPEAAIMEQTTNSRVANWITNTALVNAAARFEKSLASLSGGNAMHKAGSDFSEVTSADYA